MAAAPSSAIRWATNEDWEAHKETIEYLYCELHMPLKEVDVILRENYDLHATQRMYKSRLKKWGFRKHMSAAETREVNRQVYLGIAQLPLVRGRALGSQRLKSWLQRANDRNRRKLIAYPQSPRHLLPPQSMHISESALYEVSRYSRVAVESGCWNFSTMDALKNATSDWGMLFREGVLQVGKKHNYTVGFRLLDNCCAQFQAVLRKEEPILVWAMYLGILELTDTAEEQLTHTFTKFFVSMCLVELGAHHPLTKLIHCIQSMDINQARLSATSILGAQLDVIRQHVGRGNAFIDLKLVMVMEWLHDLGLVSYEFCFAEIDGVIKELQSSLIVDETDSSFGIIWCTLLFAGWLLAGGHYVEASAALKKVEEWHRNRRLTLGHEERVWPEIFTMKALIEERMSVYGARDGFEAHAAGSVVEQQPRDGLVRDSHGAHDRVRTIKSLQDGIVTIRPESNSDATNRLGSQMQPASSQGIGVLVEQWLVDPDQLKADQWTPLFRWVTKPK
ncbi:hypothetical protein SCUP515_04488 [Seiridium cupressi]